MSAFSQTILASLFKLSKQYLRILFQIKIFPLIMPVSDCKKTVIQNIETNADGFNWRVTIKFTQAAQPFHFIIYNAEVKTKFRLYSVGLRRPLQTLC